MATCRSHCMLQTWISVYQLAGNPRAVKAELQGNMAVLGEAVRAEEEVAVTHGMTGLL